MHNSSRGKEGNGCACQGTTTRSMGSPATACMESMQGEQRGQGGSGEIPYVVAKRECQLVFWQETRSF